MQYACELQKKWPLIFMQFVAYRMLCAGQTDISESKPGLTELKVAEHVEFSSTKARRNVARDQAQIWQASWYSSLKVKVR